MENMFKTSQKIAQKYAADLKDGKITDYIFYPKDYGYNYINKKDFYAQRTQ